MERRLLEEREDALEALRRFDEQSSADARGGGGGAGESTASTWPTWGRRPWSGRSASSWPARKASGSTGSTRRCAGSTRTRSTSASARECGRPISLERLQVVPEAAALRGVPARPGGLSAAPPLAFPCPALGCAAYTHATAGPAPAPGASSGERWSRPKEPIMSNSGLEGVVVAQTRLSAINGEKGELIYAGYDIDDLARHTTFEEVALPPLERPASRHAGSWRSCAGSSPPSARSRPSCSRSCAASRATPTRWRCCAPPSPRWRSTTPRRTTTRTQANRRKAIRLTAKMPTIVAAFDRIRNGHEPVAAARGPGHRRQLPLHAQRRGGRRAARPHLRRGARAPRRARDERLHLLRPRHGRDPLRPLLGGRLGDRHAQGRRCTAARTRG